MYAGVAMCASSLGRTEVGVRLAGANRLNSETKGDIVEASIGIPYLLEMFPHLGSVIKIKMPQWVRRAIEASIRHCVEEPPKGSRHQRNEKMDELCDKDVLPSCETWQGRYLYQSSMLMKR